MARGHPVHGHALEPKSFQNTVAALSRVAAAVPFLPGRAAIGNLAGQADGPIGVRATEGGCVPVLELRVQVVARMYAALGVVLTLLGTTPLSSSSPVIVAVEIQDVAERAEWMSILVVSSRQPDVRIPVSMDERGYRPCAEHPHAISRRDRLVRQHLRRRGLLRS